MIKEYLRNYIIRSAIIGIFSLIGNSSQNSANDTIVNKYWNSDIQNRNAKEYNTIEKIVKEKPDFYLEKDKTEYRIGQNLNFYKPK